MTSQECTLTIKGDFLIDEIRKDVEKMTIEQARSIVAQYCTCGKCKFWNGSNLCNLNLENITNPKWYCADWQPKDIEVT